jgi:beta-mannosidase
MGSIIWQLNDNCPVASWSSIEYTGKWKLMHYDAVKFFAPVGLSLYIKDNILYACGLNDTQQNIASELTLSFIGFDGKRLIKILY